MSNAKLVADNRRARFDFFIEDTVEAGIVLLGTEVKAMREGRADISEAFAREEGGEFYLINAQVDEYSAGNRFNHEPRRKRKLLMHKREMSRMMGDIRRKGTTVVPLKLYFNERGRLKVLLGVARGKKKHDKRATIKERDWQRDKARLLRER